MKTKLFLLTAIVTTLMFFSCGGKSDFDSDPFNHFYKNKLDVDDDDDDTKDDLGKMPTDSLFYERMLKKFCKLYDEEKFNYRFKSLEITRMRILDDSTAVMEGRHYFTDKKKKKKNKDKSNYFWAMVTRTGRDEYKINFETEIDDPWEENQFRFDDTTQTINYKED